MQKLSVKEIADAGRLASLDRVDSHVIRDHSILFDKIQTLSPLRLMGRGDRKVFGTVEPIVLGTNLSMNGNVLNATTSGGGAHTHNESGLTLSDNTTGNASAAAHGFCPKLSGNAAQFLNGTGAFSAPSGGSDPSGWTTIVKSANQDVTNAQNQDATELQFPVVAGNLYAVEFWLFYSGSDATGDFQYRFAVSAGTMDGIGHDLGDSASDAVGNLRLTASAVANTGSVPHGCAANVALPRPARAQFTFRHNTTNGNFKVQFGNNAAAAGRISRILKGSILRWKQLT